MALSCDAEPPLTKYTSRPELECECLTIVNSRIVSDPDTIRHSFRIARDTPKRGAHEFKTSAQPFREAQIGIDQLVSNLERSPERITEHFPAQSCRTSAHRLSGRSRFLRTGRDK